MTPTLKLFYDITDELEKEDAAEALAYALVMLNKRFGPTDVLSARVAEHIAMLQILQDWKGDTECAH